jgi:K+/H+ antiporter YhaU regulatory subunit KhtT
MKNNATPPIYSQVAFDIATKIATGELEEGQKFTGRSLMSSQYGVSPETIRRALKQLSDMEIIDVQQNVGAVVISRKNASEYIKKFHVGKTVRELTKKLYGLIEQRNRMDEDIVNLMQQILELNGRFNRSDVLKNYEFEILPDSSLVGKSIKESQFWQNTEGTIVGIRRGEEILLSPGPDIRFEPYDVIVVTGLPDVVEKVMAFIK